MTNDCLFCAIGAGDIPSFTIYEDDVVRAFLDINPFSEGHTLVVPKRHTAGLLDTADADLAAVIARVKAIAEHLRRTLPCAGFNILQNNGAAAGQTVRHLHFHIIPRTATAPVTFDGKPAETAHLKALAARLAMG